jgi:hypothetical protein
LTSRRRTVNLAFVLSVMAGVLILIGGIVWIMGSSLYNDIGLGGFNPNSGGGFFSIFGNNPPSTDMLGGLSILFAIIILVGAYYVYLPAGYEIVGGIIVILPSLVSIITAGGFIIGAILGIIGGVWGILRTREPVEEAVTKPKDKEEHETF